MSTIDVNMDTSTTVESQIKSMTTSNDPFVESEDEFLYGQNGVKLEQYSPKFNSPSAPPIEDHSTNLGINSSLLPLNPGQETIGIYQQLDSNIPSVNSPEFIPASNNNNQINEDFEDEQMLANEMRDERLHKDISSNSSTTITTNNVPFVSVVQQDSKDNEKDSSEDESDDHEDSQQPKITFELDYSHPGFPTTHQSDYPSASHRTAATTSSGGTQQNKQLDLNTPAKIDGISLYEIDIENTFDEKPWRKPGADITDYFNYGFTEETWKSFCQKQRQLRQDYKTLPTIIDGGVSEPITVNTSPGKISVDKISINQQFPPSLPIHHELQPFHLNFDPKDLPLPFPPQHGRGFLFPPGLLAPHVPDMGMHAHAYNQAHGLLPNLVLPPPVMPPPFLLDQHQDNHMGFSQFPNPLVDPSNLPLLNPVHDMGHDMPVCLSPSNFPNFGAGSPLSRTPTPYSSDDSLKNRNFIESNFREPHRSENYRERKKKSRSPPQMRGSRTHHRSGGTQHKHHGEHRTNERPRHREREKSAEFEKYRDRNEHRDRTVRRIQDRSERLDKLKHERRTNKHYNSSMYEGSPRRRSKKIKHEGRSQTPQY